MCESVAATEAKDNLLAVTLWQFENSHACSWSQWGCSAGPQRSKRHLRDAVSGSWGRGGQGYLGVCTSELNRRALCSGSGSQEVPWIEARQSSLIEAAWARQSV